MTSLAREHSFRLAEKADALVTRDAGKRMRGEGIFAEQIGQMFEVTRRKAGIPNDGNELSARISSSPWRATCVILLTCNTSLKIFCNTSATNADRRSTRREPTRRC